MRRPSKRDTRTLLEIARQQGVVTKPVRTTKLSKRELSPTEHVEQSLLVQRLALLTSKHPDLELLYAVPNGGYRNPKTAALLKAEGVRRAVPDLVLPAPRYPFHGLYVEMKRVGYKATDEQLQFMGRLARQGYAIAEAHGQDEGYRIIMAYLALPVWPEFAGMTARERLRVNAELVHAMLAG